MNYPEAYRQFFEGLVTGLEIGDAQYPTLALAQAWYGEGRQVIGKQRSEAEYPVLWIERPDFQYIHQGGVGAFTKTVEGAFSVLLQSAPDDSVQENINDDKALRIVEAVLRDMLKALYPEDPTQANPALLGAKFRLGSVVPAEAVTANTPDNLNGRRVTFTLTGIQIPTICC